MLKNVSRKLKKDQRGLTLVELLAVVVILAIVSAIAFVLIGNVIENSKKDAHIANAQQVISAVKLAEASGEVDLPLAGSVNVLTQVKTIGKIVDPWGKVVYTGITVGKNADGDYTATLAGPAKCPITSRLETDLQKGRATICP